MLLGNLCLLPALISWADIVFAKLNSHFELTVIYCWFIANFLASQKEFNQKTFLLLKKSLIRKLSDPCCSKHKQVSQASPSRSFPDNLSTTSHLAPFPFCHDINLCSYILMPSESLDPTTKYKRNQTTYHAWANQALMFSDIVLSGLSFSEKTIKSTL